MAVLALAVPIATGAAAGTAVSADAGEPSLRLPLDCVPGRTCEVIKYVDHDPGPGRRDYACGDRTGGEDNYGSTSIAIRDRKAMEAGVAVVAAAPGRVDRVRDGMDDTGVFGPETREELTARGCGNAVVIRHDGDWRTLYCHLRRGSVRVKPGDPVEAGQEIAQVGMSGLTELPHLYFGVRRGDAVVDPFVGRARAEGCGVGERPLWDAAALKALSVYKPVLPRLAGFAAAPPTVAAARAGDLAATTLPAGAPELFFWVELIGVKAGDRGTVTVTGPRGRLAEQTVTFGRDFVQEFLSVRLDRNGAAWPAGGYRGSIVLVRGTAEVTHGAEVRVE